MRRRDFIAALGGLAAMPFGARAQQKMPVVGFLATGSASAFASRLNGFRQALGELGFQEGQNLAIEYRWAGGDYDQMQAFAADLVGREVDVILASGPPSLRATSAATSTIPIVFVVGSDPVRDGLVGSMSRPDRNLTGVTFLAVDLTPKRLELVAELVPQAKVVGLLTNPTNAAEERVVADAQAAARTAGFRLEVLTASNDSEIDAAFATLVQRQVGALLVSPDTLFTISTDRIVALALSHGTATIFAYRASVASGALASYGPNVPRIYRDAGLYVGRILRGDKPGDLPVLQPTVFELVLNLKTAGALGLAIPPALLATADEVIE
ncbi:ABC transporter substrate-binding protein [Bradyrhizobium sp. AZCC 2289]|uniref:ABC transporter substrate-binding protein n=1 Tax=Bradyrhizobium sp. AZCC 2289 TaxID=3117026 RepID=UPI002FEF7647